jgi:flagellar export protein FliJ
MSFQFQLEGLLRVRRLLERQAREQLDASMVRLRTLEHELAEATQWSQQTSRTRANSASLPAAELQFIEHVLEQTQGAITHCQLQKVIEAQKAAKLRAAYLQARRERKTVSTLREKALHQFQIERSRREQSAQDEMYLGKLIYTRNNRTQTSSHGSSEAMSDIESMTGI